MTTNHVIDGHNVTMRSWGELTTLAVCECGATAVSGTEKRCAQMIHRKHTRAAKLAQNATYGKTDG